MMDGGRVGHGRRIPRFDSEAISSCFSNLIMTKLTAETLVDGPCRVPGRQEGGVMPGRMIAVGMGDGTA